MYNKSQNSDRGLGEEKPDDRTRVSPDRPVDRTGEDMRKANENVRKSQGDDAGQRPVIDRHR
jgi:hypothetical protein